MKTSEIGGLVKDVKAGQTSILKQQKALGEAQDTLRKASEDFDARLKSHEEKMASMGVAGFGDNQDADKAKFKRSFALTDFLRVVRAKGSKTEVNEKQMVYAQEAYPKEHYEKVMSAEVSEDGGFAVPEFMVNELIARLKASSVLQQAGIRSFTVPAKFGNVIMPRLTSGVTYTEVGEIATPGVSTPQLDIVTASAKRSAVVVEMSNSLLGMNAVDLEEAILADAVEDGTLRADLLGLRGSGTAFQPRGVVNTPNIGSVIAGSPDGGPVTLDLLIDLQNEVEAANSRGRSNAYIMNSRVWHQILKLREGATPGFHILPSVQFAPGVAMKPAKQVIGEPVLTFNDLPVNLTKASGTDLAEIFYGDWSELTLIRWGAMSVRRTTEATHPVTGRSAFHNKLTVFSFEQELDYVLRQPPALAVATDVDSGL